MTTWKKLNAKILAASTSAEILAALLRGEWHKTHGLEKNFPPALALALVRQIVTWKFRKSLKQNALHGDPRPTWHYIL